MKIKSADLEIHFNSKDAKNILKTQQIVSFTLQMRQKNQEIFRNLLKIISKQTRKSTPKTLISSIAVVKV